MAKAETIPVEVIYALPREQRVFTVELAQPATVRDAITRSGILGQYAQIDLSTAKVGVFGRIVSLDTALRPGDRVEIYRGLTADPKVVRRERVARKRKLARSNAP